MWWRKCFDSREAWQIGIKSDQGTLISVVQTIIVRNRHELEENEINFETRKKRRELRRSKDDEKKNPRDQRETKKSRKRY